jgi:hypothetical protein
LLARGGGRRAAKSLPSFNVLASLQNATPTTETMANEGSTTASTSAGISLHTFLGFAPTSSRLSSHLARLSTATGLDSTPEPAIKAFSDVVYYAYMPLGVTLVFQPTGSYKPKTGGEAELQVDKLRLASIDVYNHTAVLDPPTATLAATSKRTTKPIHSPFPAYPILISHPSLDPSSPPELFNLLPTSLGKDFVTALGEPERKGGGEGSIGIWTEWTGVGVLVEYASGGLQAWDKGGEAVWRTVTIFERGVTAGKEDDE